MLIQTLSLLNPSKSYVRCIYWSKDGLWYKPEKINGRCDDKETARSNWRPVREACTGRRGVYFVDSREPRDFRAHSTSRAPSSCRALRKRRSKGRKRRSDRKKKSDLSFDDYGYYTPIPEHLIHSVSCLIRPESVIVFLIVRVVKYAEKLPFPCL